MNIENIDRLIAHLEQVPDQNFDMRDWRRERDCDTVACIGGHMEILFFNGENTPLHELANTLGVCWADMNELFFIDSGGISFDNRITKQSAIRVLQNLKITGRVNWSNSMTDDSVWLGYHALDGENEEWTHFEVWRAGDKFYWNYFDENCGAVGHENGPFDTAKEAHDDANN